MLTHLLAIIDLGGLPQPNTNNTVSTALNLVFMLAASIAVLMIVIGGLRYILAHGDPSAVAQARNSMLYALVGLIIIMVAFSIVTFVVRWIA